jgi:tetratricopeptide (TPR) repeat protein
MRRVYYREGEIAASATPTAQELRMVSDAQAALAQNPNSRDRQRDLVRALSRAGQLDRARDEAQKWLDRDRLDPEALTYLADVLGRLGERDQSVRLLSGIVDLQGDDRVLHERLAQAFERAGKPERACSHQIALAEIAPTDVDLVAAAVRCERALGRPDGADHILALAADPDTRARVEESAARAPTPVRLSGNILLHARWGGPSDLDLSLVTPQGTRVSWMGGRTQAFGQESAAQGAERLGLRTASTGSYILEVARTDPSDRAPVSGAVEINVLGTRRNVPFTLGPDPRTAIARVNIVRRFRLEPAQ